MVHAAVILGGILLIAVIISPRLGLLLLWPVMLCYPHALTQNMLPLNIGFDDIFVTFVFVSVMVRAAMEGGYHRGKWNLFVLLFWFLFTISETFGMFYTQIDGAGVFILKAIIKKTSVVMIVLSLMNGIKNEKQMQRLLQSLMIATIGLSVLAILQMFVPHVVAVFYQLGADVGAGQAVARATGSTRGAFEIGGVLAAMIILSLSFLTIMRGVMFRPLVIACAILAFVAIILSKSRAGWIFTATGVLAVLVVSKKPFVAVFFVLIAASMLLFFPFLIEDIMSRVEYTVGAGQLDTSSASRIDIWIKLIKDIEPAGFLVGLGTLGSYTRHGHSPHNYYLAIWLQCGIAGIIYFASLAVSIWRQTWHNIRDAQNSTFKMALCKGIFCINIGILIFSLTTDTLNTDLVAKLFFFLWSLLYLHDSFPPVDNYCQREIYEEVGDDQDVFMEQIYY